MECQRCQEAVSARLDGEEFGIDDGAGEAAVDAHLAACAACRASAERMARVTRLVRMRRAEDAPDLVDRVMAASAIRLPLALHPGCQCASTCGCGCQDGAPCRCDHRAA